MIKVKEYLVAHEMQTHDAAEVVEEFSDEIAEMHGKCIDIGCGPAIVTREVFLPWLPADATVVGIDLSKSMIDFAKNKHKDEERLSFSQLNVESDKLPSDLINVYDNAVSFYCLHWCQEIGTACKNIFDLLRPGGKGLLIFLAYNSLYDCFSEMHKNPQYRPYMEDLSKYIPVFQKSKSPRASFKKVLKDTGFKVTHCSVREKYFPYSRESLKRLTAALDLFIDRMPAAIKENYREDMLNDLVRRKILLSNTENGSVDECNMLDKYKLIVAYIVKPNSSLELQGHVLCTL